MVSRYRDELLSNLLAMFDIHLSIHHHQRGGTPSSSPKFVAYLTFSSCDMVKSIYDIRPH